MRRINLRAGYVIFLLYTGIAVFEGVRTRNWIIVTIWSLLAITFLLLDSGKRHTAEN